MATNMGSNIMSWNLTYVLNAVVLELSLDENHGKKLGSNMMSWESLACVLNVV